ncbi:MAG: OmpA family protein [Chitinophagaceae bacterium]|nr:OmpA family protein [Chitinophagaceae bacterium]
MKNKCSCLFLFVLMCSTILLRAQYDTTAIEYKPLAADCDKAITLRITQKTTYGPTLAPNGFGERQEIVAQSKNSNTAFEQEHHSAWYLLKMAFDGQLSFDITPQDSSNDYDFILYAYTDSCFCAQVQQGKARMVRSNIRRNDIGNKGVTGLAIGAQSELQAQGPGAQFSKSLPIKKDERYMLVLDNVYNGGMGHTLTFKSMKEVTVSGTLSDEQGGKIKTDVILSDRKGNVVAATRSDDSGQYSFTARIVENLTYDLSFSKENLFFDAETINTQMIKDSSTMINIRSVLRKLVDGKKYVAGNINFHPGSPLLLPTSYSSMQALCKLMRKHNKMVIRIEGHIQSDTYDPDNERYQKLSEWRAKTVYDYLVDCGIEKGRMSAIGYSSRFLLYPVGSTHEQMDLNRRVEINVISIGR